MSVRRADLSDPRDCLAIEAFVAACPQAQLFHRPQWSRAVEAGCGATSHYLVHEDGNGLGGLLPLSEVRSPLFGNSMVSAGFGVGGGIVADTPEVAEALAEAAWTLTLDRGCSGLELRGGMVPDGEWRINDTTYANFARALPADDEAILLSIKKRQRAEVRRSQGFGLEFTEGNGPRDLDTHFRIYGASVRNLGSPVFPRRLFQAMAAEFRDDAMVLTVAKDGVPLASVFSFFFRGTVLPYWGGGTGGDRRWRASEALHHELMRRAARRGATRFDFGRSKVGTGAYDYKRNWGFEAQPLSYAVRTASGSAPREINPMSPKYRLQVAAWKKLPLPIANRLGPLIARGLG